MVLCIGVFSGGNFLHNFKIQDKLAIEQNMEAKGQNNSKHWHIGTDHRYARGTVQSWLLFIDMASFIKTFKMSKTFVLYLLYVIKWFILMKLPVNLTWKEFSFEDTRPREFRNNFKWLLKSF